MKSLFHYHLTRSIILKNLTLVWFLFLSCYLLVPLIKFYDFIFLICILKYLYRVFRCSFSLPSFFGTLPELFFNIWDIILFQSRRYIPTIQMLSSLYLCLSQFGGFLFILGLDVFLITDYTSHLVPYPPLYIFSLAWFWHVGSLCFAPLRVCVWKQWVWMDSRNYVYVCLHRERSRNFLCVKMEMCS